MVLVVTSRDDLTADWLSLELNRRETRFIRFNTEDYPNRVSLTWASEGAVLSIAETGDVVDLAAVSSVWFRRPAPPKIENDDEALTTWLVREAQEALVGVWRTMRQPLWVNHPDANHAAGCKPEQLRRASRIGFDVPPSIVTNERRALASFAAEHGSDLICKPIYDGWIPSSEGNRIFWTTRLELGDNDPLEDFGPEPCLFQRHIKRRTTYG